MTFDLYSERKVKRLFTLLVLSLGAGTIYLTPFLLNQYVNQIQIITGESLVNLQLLMTIYGVISLILYIPGGWIADRFSPKLLFSSSMLLASILTFWYSLIGVKNLINYTQLIIIHCLFAIVNSLIFWSAFIKAVGLIDSKDKHVKLYADCEIYRNFANVIVGFISIGLSSIMIPSIGFNSNGGSSLFIILIFYGSLYLLVAIISCFIIPGSWIQRYTKRNLLGMFEFKPVCSIKIIIAKDKKELKKLKQEYTTKFWKQVGNDFIKAIKNIDVWLIALLIFFVMNSYAIITAFGTVFSINYRISQETSSLLNYLYNYATPIFGALMFSGITNKKTKSPSCSTIHANFWFFLLSIALLAITCFDGSNNRFTIGIVGIVLMCLIMLFIGGNRAIYWSIMNEVNIPLGTVGITVGFISIIGFSENIWVNPLAAVLMRPYIIGNLSSNFYSYEAFQNIYIFNLVNACGALIISYILFQRKTYGRLFTKNQVLFNGNLF